MYKPYLFFFNSYGKNEDEYYDYYDEDDEKTCNTCTWTNYSTDKIFSCDSQDDECQFGIGFIAKNYNLAVHWPGSKCYQNLVGSDKNAGSHVSASGQVIHQSSTVSLNLVISKSLMNICPMYLNCSCKIHSSEEKRFALNFML